MVYFDLILLLVSIAVLVFSARTIISSTSKLSRWFKLGEFAAGFLIIAVSTSMPELAVAIMASAIGAGGLVVGNVIGANLIDVLVVLGVSALIAPVIVSQKQLIDNAEILLVISLIPLFLLLRGNLHLVEGLVLLAIFVLYALFISKQKVSLKLGKKPRVFDIMKEEIVFGASLFLLLVSARFLTMSAVNIAGFMGVPESIIGLTIISIGTTLPELAVSITAMFRRNYSLALGNILGSSVTNLTLVLGTGAVLTALSFNYLIIGSSVLMLLIANILLTFSLIKYKSIPKKMGWIFLGAYLLFLLIELGLVPMT